MPGTNQVVVGHWSRRWSPTHPAVGRSTSRTGRRPSRRRVERIIRAIQSLATLGVGPDFIRGRKRDPDDAGFPCGSVCGGTARPSSCSLRGRSQIRRRLCRGRPIARSHIRNLNGPDRRRWSRWDASRSPCSPLRVGARRRVSHDHLRAPARWVDGGEARCRWSIPSRCASPSSPSRCRPGRPC